MSLVRKYAILIELSESNVKSYISEARCSKDLPTKKVLNILINQELILIEAYKKIINDLKENSLDGKIEKDTSAKVPKKLTNSSIT